MSCPLQAWTGRLLGQLQAIAGNISSSVSEWTLVSTASTKWHTVFKQLPHFQCDFCETCLNLIGGVGDTTLPSRKPGAHWEGQIYQQVSPAGGRDLCQPPISAPPPQRMGTPLSKTAVVKAGNMNLVVWPWLTFENQCPHLLLPTVVLGYMTTPLLGAIPWF